MKLSDKKINETIKESDEWGPGRRTKKPIRRLTKKEGEEVLEKGGLQLITIRLPFDVIEELKLMAGEDGVKYQPYLRKVLIQHTRNKNSSLEARVSKIENLVMSFGRKKTGT